MAEFTPIEVSTWIKKLGPRRSMVLEGLRTRVIMMMIMMMMMMTMMMMVVTLRRLPATRRGKGVTGNPIDKQIDTDTDIQQFFFPFPLLACIFELYVVFETLGCI